MLLSDRIALVTGASRGIGRATAIRLAAEGASIILGARSAEQLAETCTGIREAGGSEPLVIPYDVTDLAGLKAAFATIHKTFKRLDILVNNAGVLDDALLGMVSPAQMQRTFGINTEAVIYHMQYASRLMARQKRGSIINVSSIIGRFGNEGQVVYAASKAAVIGATMSAAKELAASGIRVNAIAPGFIDTDMARSLPPEKFQERIDSIKMGRIGSPDEVANVILFLASDLASYVTGQVIGVDGGMLI